MSSVFPSRSISDAPPPSAASQVPFLKNVSKSMKHKPEIIRKIARTASAKNSLDLNRPSHEQIHHYDSNPSLDGQGSGGIHKLNRSGSSLSGFGGSGGLEIGTSRQRGLAGIGRGASYHARSTSGTSGISAWSSHTRESGGTTPVGGAFRHPWQQTPTVQRGSFTGAPSGGGSYNEPNGFGRVGIGSDEDLRERERERDMQGRRSLQLGGGYGFGLDGVDEGYERYERPAFERPALGRSNTSATVHSGSGFGVPTRASYREGESRTYTPISQLPPPLAGSKARGMGGLRVNTSGSGISVAGVVGRGAVVGSNGGNVTPVSSSSRVNLGSLNGGSNPDVNSASGLPLNNISTNILINSTNNYSTSTNNSTLYNTQATSIPDLHLSNLNTSPGHLHNSASGSHITTSHADTSTTSPMHNTPSPSTFKTRPSFDMHVPYRLRGKSEPKDIDEAKRMWREKEDLKKAKEEAELAKKDEKERVKEEKRIKRQEKRGRTSTTSIGSFALGRGRSDTDATAGTAATYSTAMGSVVSGVPSHRRGGSEATARQNSGTGRSAPASYRNHGYSNSYDMEDPANTQAPAFLDTGEYVPSEAEMAAAASAAAAAAAAAGRNRAGIRDGSPKAKEVKDKIYAAKSRSHSAWASFMLWLKTRILKMGRSGRRIVKGGKNKVQ